jgi:integrase
MNTRDHIVAALEKAAETGIAIDARPVPSKPRGAKRTAKTARQKSRIYWRKDAGREPRAYCDLRDIGGGLVALIAEGDRRATTDPLLAEQLAAKELERVMGAKRDKVLGVREPCPLSEYAIHHLNAKKSSGKYSPDTIDDSARMLEVAAAHFGAERDLASIKVADVQGYVDYLQTRPTRRKRSDEERGTLGNGTIRHYLNALSSLFERAISEERVPVGYNPVTALVDKPEPHREEAKSLVAHEAALLLESARTYKPARADIAFDFTYELVATCLLVGGRESEILGLQVQDIEFANGTVWIRPNECRRLKTKRSERAVPLWPQLRDILKAYLKRTNRKAGLLFPSPFLDKPGMITDWRKQLDAIATRTKLWKAGDVRSKMFRHCYCSTRLQTLQADQPVAVYTVSREMGHSSTAMVEKVYAHVQNLPKRSNVVQYRIEQHRAKLAPHLKLLKAG